MRLIHTKKALCRDFSSHPGSAELIHESDLSVRGSKLKAKLLVFKNRRGLLRFWKQGLDYNLIGRPLGVVHQLTTEHMLFKKSGEESRWIEADPRYFCVIGLVKGFLSMEIISHEAMHAGFAFAKRIKRSPWDAQAKHFDEEAICYPAGNIAAEINRALFKANLYE